MATLICATLIGMVSAAPQDTAVAAAARSDQTAVDQSTSVVAPALRVDFFSLLALVRPEPDLARRMDELSLREGRAKATLLLGTALVVGSIPAAAVVSDVCGGAAQSHCAVGGLKLAGGMIASGVLLGAIAALLSPSGNEYRRIVEMWNTRHPERPAEWTGFGPL